MEHWANMVTKQKTYMHRRVLRVLKKKGREVRFTWRRQRGIVKRSIVEDVLTLKRKAIEKRGEWDVNYPLAFHG